MMLLISVLLASGVEAAKNKKKCQAELARVKDELARVKAECVSPSPCTKSNTFTDKDSLQAAVTEYNSNACSATGKFLLVGFV